MSRSSLLLLVAVPAMFLMACGSDTSTGTTGTGGSDTTSTSATGTGGAGTGGVASTTATGTTTGTASSTGTAMAMGACTNDADLGVASTKDVKKIAQDCGTSKLGAEPATKDCIKTGTGLSDDCVTCFDDIVQCVVKNCFSDCAADPTSAACNTCRDTKCNPAFVTCSGLPSN